MEISDNCPCGADLTVKGLLASTQHDAWLEAHAVCRLSFADADVEDLDPDGQPAPDVRFIPYHPTDPPGGGMA